MIASLPMYDRPETAAANDRFWALIHDSLGDFGIKAPSQLTRGADPWQTWLSPDLCMSQTCGLPYRTKLHGHVTLIATPVYNLPCDPGYYFSVIIAHKDDTRSEPSAFNGATLAYNDGHSQSGWAAANDWAQTNGVAFGQVLESGGHLNSALAVAEVRADVAAIDALTWALIQRWDAFADQLQVVAQTNPTPTLPYISAKGTKADLYARALSDAAKALTPQDSATLGLKGFVQIPAEQYLAIPTPELPPR